MEEVRLYRVRNENTGGDVKAGSDMSPFSFSKGTVLVGEIRSGNGNRTPVRRLLPWST